MDLHIHLNFLIPHSFPNNSSLIVTFFLKKTQQPSISLMFSGTLSLLSRVVIANLESITVYEQWRLFFSQCMTFHLLTLISSVISLLNIMRLFCHSSHLAYVFTILINSVSLHKKSPLSSPPFHTFYESRSLECWWFLAVKNDYSPYPLFPIFHQIIWERVYPSTPWQFSFVYVVYLLLKIQVHNFELTLSK